MLIYPAIDLRGGRVVRLRTGTTPARWPGAFARPGPPTSTW